LTCNEITKGVAGIQIRSDQLSGPDGRVVTEYVAQSCRNGYAWSRYVRMVGRIIDTPLWTFMDAVHYRLMVVYCCFWQPGRIYPNGGAWADRSGRVFAPVSGVGGTVTGMRIPCVRPGPAVTESTAAPAGRIAATAGPAGPGSPTRVAG
jgi:hypothetical protein